MTKPDSNPNTKTNAGSAANLPNTDAELLREAAEDAAGGEIVEKSRHASDPSDSRDIASGSLTEGAGEAAYPPSSARAHDEADGWFGVPPSPQTSAPQTPAPARQSQGLGADGVGIDNDPSDGDVSMDSPMGKDLLEGDLVGYGMQERNVQVVRGDSVAGADVTGARPKERFVIVDGENKQPSFLDTLRGRVQEGVSELQERGEQLAFAAKLKLEMRQLESDRDALFTRLGRAYFRRAEPDVLAVIENELSRIERDIRICENQMEAHEQHVERVKVSREHEQLKMNYPKAETSAATAFEMRAQTPRIQHEIGTEKRDTFFGLDKGGVDEQVTVAGGNAAFDTQRDDLENAPLTISDLPEDER